MPKQIEKFLIAKRESVDKVIEKYLPRRVSSGYLEFLLGKPALHYNKKLLQATIFEPAWNFFDRGGKRLRPVLYLLVLEALGGNLKKAGDFLIIPELIHSGTLIIDDIEDKSELRRGKPCCHQLFGEDIAINLGNLLYFLPLRIFVKHQNDFKPEIFQKAYQAYIQEMITVSVGQAIDIGWHNMLASKISEDEYFEMASQKSGALLRLTMKLAAIFAGASDETIEKLSKASEKMAVAFQIQDDILDATLEENARNKFGKSPGNDIKEGKMTLMVIYTLNRANQTDKQKLLGILNQHTNDPRKVKIAIRVLGKYGAIEYAQEKARQLIKEAQKEMDKIFMGRKNQKIIQALINFLVKRKY